MSASCTFSKGIEVKGVVVSYDDLKILENICVNIRKGTLVALLGPNGCGKTTLLKTINGMLKVTGGVIFVNGKSTESTDPVQMARTMGVVSQVHRSTFPFTVEDVVLTGRMPHISMFSMPAESDFKKVGELLEMLGIDHLRKKPYTLISGGERQLVMIAKALAQEPEFLLLDEPTSFLDLKNQVHVLSMVVRQTRSRNITVLMTLHDPNHALLFADEIVLMKKIRVSNGNVGPKPGKGDAFSSDRIENIVASGDPRSVMTPANIKEAYGIDVEVLDHNGRRLVLPISEIIEDEKRKSE